MRTNPKYPLLVRAGRHLRDENRRRISTALGLLLIVAALAAGCASRNYPGPVHGLTFDGTLQSIDPQKHQLVLVPLRPGEPVVFTYDSTTRFWKNEIPIRAEEMEAGRSVRVHYHRASGRLVAHHVYIQIPYAPH